jgi:hypothetical protein
LYQQWNQLDPAFASVSPYFPGLRLIQSDPVCFYCCVFSVLSIFFFLMFCLPYSVCVYRVLGGVLLLLFVLSK